MHIRNEGKKHAIITRAIMIMMINVMIPFLLHDPGCENCAEAAKKGVENAVIILQGGQCEKNVQIGSFNYGEEKMTVYF